MPLRDSTSTIFERAVALDSAQREAFVRQACGNDVARARRLMDLLANDDKLEALRVDPKRFLKDRNFDLLGLKAIGQGAFGAVWMAWNRTARKLFAIKIIPPERRIELDAIRRIMEHEHQHLTPITLVMENHGWVFCVMPLADSANGPISNITAENYAPMTLRAAVNRAKPFTPSAVARIGRELADAVHLLHACGMLHGDIKPENTLSFSDQWKIADYGLLMDIDNPMPLGATDKYLAPEQKRSRASDQYALGVTLREVLPPRRWEFRDVFSPEAWMRRRMERVLVRMTAPSPEFRYPSLQDAGAAMKAAATFPRRVRQTGGILATMAITVATVRYGAPAVLPALATDHVDRLAYQAVRGDPIDERHLRTLSDAELARFAATVCPLDSIEQVWVANLRKLYLRGYLLNSAELDRLKTRLASASFRVDTSEVTIDKHRVRRLVHDALECAGALAVYSSLRETRDGHAALLLELSGKPGLDRAAAESVVKRFVFDPAFWTLDVYPAAP